MPVNKIKKKCQNDKFYTKPEVAIECVSKLKRIVGYTPMTFIEPSAGSGAFSSLMNCFAFDLEPAASGIFKQDFLQFSPSGSGLPICFFGNPPFGERNSLTKAFTKQAMSYRASKVIAFVLPMVFKKHTMQKLFPANWSLVSTTDLPNDSFIFNGESYHVPCVFQIWEKDSSRQNLREVPQPKETVDFAFVSKKDADIFVFGAAPKKIVIPSDVSTTNRGYYLKSKIDVDELCDRIRSVDWKSYAASSVNGGVAWFSKDEFVKSYNLTHGI